MKQRVLITGSGGLVGSTLSKYMISQGYDVVRFDTIDSSKNNICNFYELNEQVATVDGVIHLAAVSRVVWAERCPMWCKSVNEVGFKSLLDICQSMARKPWLVFASSREVYGEQSEFPVREHAPLRPMNYYARSKVFGERLVSEARNSSLVANTVRLSNVYGSVLDHGDRVVPAFAKAAAGGGKIYVEGKDNSFGFTHISDVVRGLFSVVEITSSGELLPTMHLASPESTSLNQLAEIAQSMSSYNPEIVYMEGRRFDVSKFVGDTALAKQTIGWQSTVELRKGFRTLMLDYINESGSMFETIVADRQN